ncbi:hypothetical protein [Algoriphagus pacificus]|uniref:Uncharacterized protein n=1 Tax=Algoriphagus pacificus TaxID=2811234 RepID=A0ABS3CIF2_9BACT|nr:hypothetical protein [Algoriphagus pacificus]MBN7816875.1 hypothetical protein [Algoriphagus pacificus]
MKRLGNNSFIVLLLLGMLSMNLDLCCQIEKVPFLISHFEEHKALDGDTIIEFFIEDYIDHGSGENHHNEKGHEKLPFHGSHTCSHAPIYFSTINDFILPQSFSFLGELESYYNFHFTSPVLDELFQPPRI